MARAGLRLRCSAALAVGFTSLLLYHSTLLPGFDLGDTASFQTMAGSPAITPRDGYPLYFAIGGLFVRAVGGDRAHALNVASATSGAIACGLVVLVAANLAGSLPAGLAAGLLLAGSYTFWSQATIAEVYTLHVALVTLTLLLLLRWMARPTIGRLAWFFAVYALGFGNHLSMALLAPVYALVLLRVAPGGWRAMVTPRIVALATGMAAAGALQYAWNFQTLWSAAAPPQSLTDALQLFWFDVTKADWRETMVMRMPVSMIGERLRMYAFDAHQQFGWAGILLAGAGAVALGRADRARGALVLGLYVVNVLFAFSYNVGDAHVFFLPSHLMLALLAAPGIALLGRVASAPTVVAALVVLLVGGRIYRDYPALDRSADHRPTQALETLTTGLDDSRAILLVDLNWQLQNGLTYFSQAVRPEIAYALMPEVLRYAPALIEDNLDIGRDVVMSERAAAAFAAAYGPRFAPQLDPALPRASLAGLTRDLPRGTRYVVAVLRPAREFQIDLADLTATFSHLTGGPLNLPATEEYVAVAGLVGEAPVLIAASDRPFRRAVDLAGVPVQIRMESWLAFDTIRRMGFGHVIAAHHHTAVLERGVTVVALDDAGRATRTGYGAGLYAPQVKYLIRAR